MDKFESILSKEFGSEKARYIVKILRGFSPTGTKDEEVRLIFFKVIFLKYSF